MPSEISPLISTIIPTYQRAGLLRRAILSVLAQSGPELQVCVYDNASGDETAAMVAELAANDARVKYHRHDQNIGGFKNFQYGLSRVTTPFFSILSDDDVLLPGFFDHAMHGFQTFPQAAFWAGVTVRMTAAGTVYDAYLKDWPREGLFSPPEGLLEMTYKRAPIWTGVIFRRRVLEEIGLVDPAVGAPGDLDFLLRAAARYAFVISKDPVAILFLNPESFSENSPFSAYWPGWLELIRNVTANDALSEDIKAQMAQRLHADVRRMLFRRGANALSKRHYDFALQAASVLKDHYGEVARARLLHVLTTQCSRFSPLQQLYNWSYHTAVRLSLRQRAELQRRYGYLAQHLRI